MALYSMFLQGLEFLGSTQLGSGAATTSSVTIPARDYLIIVVRVTGYAGSDIASLQFNGDTAANYQSQFRTSAAAGTTFSNVEFNGVTNGKHIRVAATAATVPRSAIIGVTNISTIAKVCTINTASFYSNAIATASQIDVGGCGVWNNTAAQITSIVLATPGANNMNTGTGFAVFGRNM